MPLNLFSLGFGAAFMLVAGCSASHSHEGHTADGATRQVNDRAHKPGAGFSVTLSNQDVTPRKPFLLEATLHSPIARKDLTVKLTAPDGTDVLEGSLEQTVSLKAKQDLVLTWKASVPDSKRYTFAIHASHGGRVAADGVHVGDSPPVKPTRVMQTGDGRPVME